MKLSKIRPCDVCGGKLAPSFYVVRMSIALFRPRETNEVLGLAQFFQGALGLAEVFAPDDPVVVAMDDPEHKGLMHEFFVCAECYLKPLTLAEIVGPARMRRADDEIRAEIESADRSDG